MNLKSFQFNKNGEELIASLRAIVNSDSLSVEFSVNKENNFFSWNQDLMLNTTIVSLPAINNSAPSTKLIKNFRPVFDLAACYLLFHNKDIHQYKDFNEEEKKIFDEFEKARVIVNIKNSYQGIVKNILQKIEDDLFENPKNLFLLLLNQVFADKVLPKTKREIFNLQQNTEKKILSQITNLNNKITSQTEFSLIVDKIIELLRKEKESKKEEEKKPRQKNKETKKNNDNNNSGQEDSNNNTNDSSDEIQKLEEQGEKEPNLKEQEQEIKLSIGTKSENKNKIELRNPYKIYSSQFDETIFPQKIIPKHELETLRSQLELKLCKLSSISKKMSLKLKKKLLSKKNYFLEHDSTRGILDRKKLTQLITGSTPEDIWVNNKAYQYQNTALTILLDNSGSMRGRPIIMSTLACEIIAQILEKFLVKTEIIGFTTADWRGGKTRKLWENSGKPKNPGRLNELRHIIYKHFNQKLSKAKLNLGLMLKEGALKENIDGEALLFARSRLMQQNEQRKILLVISDGAPIDDSTLSANDSDILSDHLHHVINKIEKSNKIEIVGIGIGHSTKEFYQNSITIKDLKELGDVMIEKISQLL